MTNERQRCPEPFSFGKKNVHEKERRPINQIICGDCLEVMKEMPDNYVDLVITDPPYFIPAQSYVGKRGEGNAKRNIGDTSIMKGYFERVFEELDRITKKSGTWYVFCDAQSYPIFYQVMFPFCGHVRLLVWDKIVSYNGYTWRHQHELIAWGERDDAKRIETGDGDIIKCRGVLQKDRNHPAEKPVILLQKLIEKHEKGLVLDLFCGSGSTLVACSNLGRDCIGIEIDAGYCEITKHRVSSVSKKLEAFV